eukprot:symbB.v1.2.027714.t1/scaffold2861.1/size68641/4
MGQFGFGQKCSAQGQGQRVFPVRPGCHLGAIGQRSHHRAYQQGQGEVLPRAALQKSSDVADGHRDLGVSVSQRLL